MSDEQNSGQAASFCSVPPVTWAEATQPQDVGLSSGDSAQGSTAPIGAPSSEPASLTDVDRAFKWLRQALSQLDKRAARTTAAGLKSEMMKLADGEFRESDLGFTSFRGFLEAAEVAGIVTLELPTPGSGQDVLVFLSERFSARPAGSSSRLSRRRIRPDLWTAFVDWNPKFIRLWDRSAERAVILLAEPSAGEPAALTRLRQRYAEAPQDFIAIEPIGQDEHLGWMREFAESVAMQAPDLQASLDTPRPAAAFARALRSDPAIGDAWRSRLSTLVLTAIQSWTAEHDLNIDVFESPAMQKPAERPAQLTRSSGYGSARERTTQERALRAQLLAVLSELSTDELLQIRVPIVYALRI